MLGATMRVSNAILTTNYLLASMPQSEEALLRPYLSRVRLVSKQILVEPGRAAEHVYFIEDGLALLIAETRPRRPGVQVAMIGREGMVGGLSLLDADSPAFGCVVTQIPGMALRIPVSALRQCLDRNAVLRDLCFRSIQHMTRQIMNSAASAATDSLVERCVHWLLMAHDRIDGDDLPVTHEALSSMLGVRRSGVTIAMCELQEAGLIRATRGRIRIMDRRGLEAFARHGKMGGLPPVPNGAVRAPPQLHAASTMHQQLERA